MWKRRLETLQNREGGLEVLCGEQGKTEEGTECSSFTAAPADKDL